MGTGTVEVGTKTAPATKTITATIAADDSLRAFEATEADATLFARLLRSFVPPNAFDAHAHLYRVDQQGDKIPAYMARGPQMAGRAAMRRAQQMWMGDRTPAETLVFPMPYADMDVPAANRFDQRESSASNGSRWLMLARPSDDPDTVERMSRDPGCCGFKVYHCFSTGGARNTFAADADAFIPTWLWEICQRRSLAIMLHLVKPRALAEPENQRYIREHCIRYPNAKLILAHAARGFCGRHTVEGIGAIRGLDNVYFDTSVVCESTAIEAILKTFGPTRLMYGSDFPLSELRGRSLSIADGFIWLYRDSIDYRAERIDGPTLIGIESLLAVKQACANLGLNDSDVEQIFCRTGREVLEIQKRSPRDAGSSEIVVAEARGCETIDTSGRRFIDMTAEGVGATLLGFADPDVTAAVTRRAMLGTSPARRCADEQELPTLLADMHPWARQVLSAATASADPLARAGAVATIKKLARVDFPAHVDRIGARLRDGLSEIAQRHHVPLTITGSPALLRFELPTSIAEKWRARMLELGYLVSDQFAPTLAHEEHHIDAFLAACDSIFAAF